MKIRTIVICLSSLLLSSLAHADRIEYTVDNLGGDRWQYNYTLDNLGSNAIGLFSIYFDLGLYDNLELVASPATWDTLVLQPDPFIPDDGILDALSLEPGGTAPGEQQGGFSVAFDFLGVGAPGEQFFDIFDPDTFEILASGITELRPTPVPAPATLLLFATGLMLILIGPTRRRSIRCAARLVS